MQQRKWESAGGMGEEQAWAPLVQISGWMARVDKLWEEWGRLQSWPETLGRPSEAAQ